MPDVSCAFGPGSGRERASLESAKMSDDNKLRVIGMTECQPGGAERADESAILAERFGIDSACPG
ncbi:MAG: hypothetical protein F4113_07025 [Rhodothermaceae bacterium]|nr:hypothetical protein [Rhodothermaceae bacterium]